MTSNTKADGSALTGVSETALLTLLVRATEARMPDSIIDDPMAIKLVDDIDFDFSKFGFTRRQDMAPAGPHLRQVHAALSRRPPFGDGGGASRGSADQLLPAGGVRRQ